LFNTKRPLELMLVLAACNVQAQSPSVGELIAKSKAARTAELMGAPVKPVGNEAKKKPMPSQPVVQPKLWSITGVDQNLTAVLLIQQKAYTVASHDLPVNLGAWEVTQISHQQVWLRELKASDQKARSVVLKAIGRPCPKQLALTAMWRTCWPTRPGCNRWLHPCRPIRCRPSRHEPLGDGTPSQFAQLGAHP
jgi:hypothetical protein